MRDTVATAGAHPGSDETGRGAANRVSALDRYARRPWLAIAFELDVRPVIGPSSASASRLVVDTLGFITGSVAFVKGCLAWGFGRTAATIAVTSVTIAARGSRTGRREDP
jgi:hypothetical protein